MGGKPSSRTVFAPRHVFPGLDSSRRPTHHIDAEPGPLDAAQLRQRYEVIVFGQSLDETPQAFGGLSDFIGKVNHRLSPLFRSMQAHSARFWTSMVAHPIA